MQIHVLATLKRPDVNDDDYNDGYDDDGDDDDDDDDDDEDDWTYSYLFCIFLSLTGYCKWGSSDHSALRHVQT